MQDAISRDPLPMRPLPRSIPPGDPSRGRPDAPVVVHEWCGFYPACQIAEQTVRIVRQRYGDEVRFVWHDLALYAPFPSIVAREAFAQRGATGFWAMHDKIFVDRSAYTRDKLEGYARALGLEMDSFRQGVDGPTHAPELEADKAAAEAANVGDGPAFLIASRGASSAYLVRADEPPSRFRRVIDRAVRGAH
jgi:protein-disulfide isomerase